MSKGKKRSGARPGRPQPMRVALTGGGVSPSIDHTIYLCGQQGAMQRIDAALQYLG